jgi:hypothetical protein
LERTGENAVPRDPDEGAKLKRLPRGPIFEFLADAGVGLRAGALLILGKSGALNFEVIASRGLVEDGRCPDGMALPTTPFDVPSVDPELPNPLTFWLGAEKLPCPATQLEAPPDPEERVGDFPVAKEELEWRVFAP